MRALRHYIVEPLEDPPLFAAGRSAAQRRHILHAHSSAKIASSCSDWLPASGPGFARSYCPKK